MQVIHFCKPQATTHHIMSNCAYLVYASLNSLYIPLSVLSIVGISAALE